MSAERTGYRGIDSILEQAEARGLLTEVDRSRGDFVIARIKNHGRAGDNGLNDQQIVLYVSFSQSTRGRFCGGAMYQTIGKAVGFAKSSRGLSSAAFWTKRLYLAPEFRQAPKEYRFADRSEAERWALERGLLPTIEIRPEGASIVGVDDYRPFVLLVQA